MGKRYILTNLDGPFIQVPDRTCAQSRMGGSIRFHKFSTFHSIPPVDLFHPSFPKPSEVLKYGSAVPSSGRERGAVQRRQARTFESQIWGMAQPSCSLWDPFWTKRSMNLIQELRPWRGCLHTSKHRSVRFDQRGNQLLINKELLISQCHFSHKAERPLLLLTTSVLGS